jgi:DNA primase
MDVIAMHQYGIPLAVASCGTAFTAEQIKLLRRYTENIIFLFDNDEA